jgi:hypothetical protein
MPEEGGGGTDNEVEGLPNAAAEADAEIGSDYDDGDYDVETPRNASDRGTGVTFLQMYYNQ